ncbi:MULTISPECIES: helix-turn-helix domain-containing protein [unclassified Coprococcus]|jgi:transcriptional regulator with XRE-family HTH domain|uniref:helix-turn-helix domain-containing protein n=1 Tax=unclassified Coprococcus TaxID=2684943 RepID=UPI000E555E18|nr:MULTISPECIES: helix-turn-helix transcriptional regulator [unclassified Coprococcus]NSJ88640.1 helix-turn-helix transcriptional regulator [Coprococcus sp. MSK.21.13]RGI38716.1 XRE family transcriptional regulator [Coprococcus sp. OM06-34AC]RGI41663.1 XRE family transcriptional regulator [Coprococcus sp. OM06-25]
MANTHESYEYPVGDRLRFFREQKQISTNKLANLAGISQSYVRDIEMGNKNPTIEVLFQLCKALDISLRDFFDDDNKVLLNDPLSTRIYRLNSVQREALLAFLNTID